MKSGSSASLRAGIMILAVGCGSPAGSAALQAVLVAQGFNRPVYVIAPPGDGERLFVLEQLSGRIKIVKNGAVTGTFLTVPNIIKRPDGGPVGELGLVGMVFHPDFCTNRKFYLYYNTPGPEPAGRSILAEHTASETDPDIADPEGRIILQFERYGEWASLHNGGSMSFGPDGYLYLTSGDGSDGARSRILSNNWFGKILRIDVNGDDFPADELRNYAIPPTNPLLHLAGAEEIWAYGLRNPWRASFDRLTGDFYISDVGERTAEEVNFQPAGSWGGEDYGWYYMEGDICAAECPEPNCACLAEGLTPPTLVYYHNDGCSVIGGFVYRGSAIPELYGRYVYGDFCRARIWSVRISGGRILNQREHTAELTPASGPRINRISSFGQDAAGELYVADIADGQIFKIVRDPALITSAPPVCGCDETDTDGDGVPDCLDRCAGAPDTDADDDGLPDCRDGCPNDPHKIAPGVCGCGQPDTDTDEDGTPDCRDDCPNDPAKTALGVCGCERADTDSDGDDTPDCHDLCPSDAAKTEPGICGCGHEDLDRDADGTPDCVDACPLDPDKTRPGLCGCGESELDSDHDGVPDCLDACPFGPDETMPGVCGCGVSETDTDEDGTPDCIDGCPLDPLKTTPGACSCGQPDTDTDEDGTPDCRDDCPNDPAKTALGACGCGIPDDDTDGDEVPDCSDNCPQVFNPEQTDTDVDGVGDACQPERENKSTSQDSTADSDGNDESDEPGGNGQAPPPLLNQLLCRLCGAGCTFAVVLVMPGLLLLRVSNSRCGASIRAARRQRS